MDGKAAGCKENTFPDIIQSGMEVIFERLLNASDMKNRIKLRDMKTATNVYLNFLLLVVINAGSKEEIYIMYRRIACSTSALVLKHPTMIKDPTLILGQEDGRGCHLNKEECLSRSKDLTSSSAGARHKS